MPFSAHCTVLIIYLETTYLDAILTNIATSSHSVSDFKGTTYLFRMNKSAPRDAAFETMLTTDGHPSLKSQLSYFRSGTCRTQELEDTLLVV